MDFKNLSDEQLKNRLIELNSAFQLFRFNSIEKREEIAKLQREVREELRQRFLGYK